MDSTNERSASTGGAYRWFCPLQNPGGIVDAESSMGIRQRLSDEAWTRPASAIADESERLRLLVDAVDEYAIFLLAPDGTVMTWNPGAERLKGYTGQEIVGRHFSVFYPPADVAVGQPARELAEASRDGLFVDDGWRVRKDGSRFWAHVVITALFDGATLQGFAKVTRDDTTARAAAERGRAMQDITRGLLAGAEPAAVLSMVTQHACHLTGAGRSWLAVRQGTRLIVCAADGMLPGPQIGAVLPDERFASSVLTKSGQARFVDDLRVSWPSYPDLDALGAGLLVPMVTGAGITGVLVAAAPAGASPFRQTDLELLQAFAQQAELILSYDVAQQALRSQQVSDDRERIARDLHDHVIQELFATGIGLQAAAARSRDASVQTSLEQAVDCLDATIRQIRMTIFDLHERDQSSPGGSVRADIAALVRDAGRALAFKPTLHLNGPIDTVIEAATSTHLLAALREMLSNVARHAQASAATVSVTVGSDVTVTVTDNGNGPPKDTVTGNGLRNLQSRARALDGSFALLTAPDHGAEATLRIPLPLDLTSPTSPRPAF
jgi:PAS domain S-box-containing protein